MSESGPIEHTSPVGDRGLRELYRRFVEGDLSTIDAMFAEDAICYVLGSNRLSLPFEGRAAIREFFQRTLEMTTPKWRTTVLNFIRDGKRCVAVTKSVGDGVTNGDVFLGVDIIDLDEAGRVMMLASLAAPMPDSIPGL